MAKASQKGQIQLNDGLGNPLPIQTGTWVSKAYDMDEQRRLSVTLGVWGSTASGTLTQTGGGFTGLFIVQGTDELGQCMGFTGTPQMAAGQQPGQNGSTGALFWQNVQSGTIGITPTTTSLFLQFTDFGFHWCRFVFNANTNGTYVAGNSPSGAGGTGTMLVYFTSKST